MAEQSTFARRMMAQKLMAEKRDDPFSDSPFFSVPRAEPKRISDFAQFGKPALGSITPYQVGATGSLFAPGAGIADVMGYAPDPMQSGQMLPSFGENIGQGNYLDAGLQTLGVAGDVLQAGGAIFPPLAAAGTALKAPRAARVALSPEIIRNIASGSNRNPKTLAKRLRKEGLLNVEDKAQQDAFYAEFNRITDLQRKRRAAKNKDDMFGSFSRKRDQLKLRREVEAREQKRKIVENSIKQSPMFEAWTKPNRDRVLKASYDAQTIDAEAMLATVEAIAREAKKRGLEVYYTSKGQRGRAGSRYLELPDGGKVRVSDHELPDTAQREYNRSQGIGNYADEIIVSDWETSSVDDYLKRILGEE